MAEPSELLKPQVYAASGSAALPDHPALLGGMCLCGHVFFPMQTYGCEKCGRHGDALQPKALSGSGRVVALATVHLHAGKGRAAPFTVATIALDDGPVLRTLLAAQCERDVKPGARVVTTLVPVTREDGTSALDLRFTRPT
jgi:hypothetical protein